MTGAAGPSRSAKIAPTLAYFLSISLLGAFTALGGPALPTLAANTSTPLERISLYFVLGSLGYLLGSLLGGRGIDRLPGNRLLSLTLLAIAVSGALIPIAQRLWWLLAVQFTLGLAQGINDVGCNTMLLWIHSKNAGPYLNGLHFSYGVGTFLAPLVLAGILAGGWNIEGAFWIFALLCLPLAGWLWTLPGKGPREDDPQADQKNPPVFPMAFLVLAFLFYVGAEIGFGDWIYTYALARGLGTAVTSATLTSAFWGALTAGRLLGIWIAARFRPFAVLLADLVGCLAGLGIILLWQASPSALWIGSIVLGLSMASIFPTMLLLAGERMAITGQVTSWFLVGGGAGSMLLPWLIGQAFSGVGAGAMPALILSAVALNLICVLIFSRRT